MGRAPCCDKDGLKKGPWTPEEDQKLIDYIQNHGCGNWRTLPKNAGLQRCGKSCRLRWTNYLRPDIKRGRFSFEEEEMIIRLHSILGNKWSAIAARLPGRTDNEIKNYWNTHIRKRLLRMGIDPVTHNPRLDLLDLSSILDSSLYNSPQINVSTLLGVQQQPVVNQELLRLVTSLCSPQVQTHQDHYQPLVQDSQFQSPVEEMSNCTALTGSPCVPFSNESQFMDHNVEQYPTDHFSNFSSQNCQLNWQKGGMAASSLTEDYYVPSYYDNNYYGSHQSTMMDPPSVTSTFMSNNSNHSLSFAASVLSTPSSSSTAPLNSNSTAYFNGSSSTEDERESYCSNILKFEIPDILHVNNSM